MYNFLLEKKLILEFDGQKYNIFMEAQKTIKEIFL